MDWLNQYEHGDQGGDSLDGLGTVCVEPTHVNMQTGGRVDFGTMLIQQDDDFDYLFKTFVAFENWRNEFDAFSIA